jgi:filamentous hemagglutinin family protein
MLAASAAMNAHAATNLANIGAQMSAARNAAAAGGVNLGVGVSPQKAFQASQPSIQNLAHAAQGIAQQIATQQATAAASVGALSNVPNGLAVGGLQVAPGASSDVNNPALWINANLPTQSVDSSGHVDVEVQQTAQNAVATWQTMNVGSNTTLNFDQSAGTQTNGANNWVILNRIIDPSGRPSQIMGKITAQGTVLVINRNGILFGAGSQVNVHSLVASSLDLLNTTDDQTLVNIPGNVTPQPFVPGNLVQDAAGIEASNQLFLNGGFAAAEAGQTSTTLQSNGNPTELLGLGNNVAVTSASQLQTPGDITIAAGASITTSADGVVSNGGLVLIAAPNVTNAGSITTAPTGQVILAAGLGVSLTPNANNPQLLLPELSGKVLIPTSSITSIDITPAGTLTNTGIVQSPRGNITLLGSSVAQNGVVGVTTSVSTPGSITISTVDEYQANTPLIVTNPQAVYPGEPMVTDQTNGEGLDIHRAGLLTFGDGSVTTILPDSDGETATSIPGTTFTPGSVQMTAGSIWFQSGSLVEAPGSTVSVTALTLPDPANTPPGDTAVQGRIFLDSGATIDVSGLANVELPISDILVTVPLIGANELANSPLLRESFLDGLKNVIVDSTLSGTNPDGSQWVGSPVLNLSGDVSLIPRSVNQLLTNGGTITLSGAQVMTADGSSLNLNGGYVHYLGGMVDTTRLIDSSGAIVPIGQANPNDTFVGIAGEFIETHPRWGVTNDWFDALLSGGAFEPDFIVGGNAGTLNVYASQTMVLDGNITAEAFGGQKQVQGNAQPTGGSFTLGLVANDATLGPGASGTGEPGTVILQGSAPQLGNLPSGSNAGSGSGSGSGFNAETPLDTTALGALANTDPNNVFATMVVPVDTLNSGGFANVSINDTNQLGGAGIVVAAGTQLKVQPGGSIKLTSPDATTTVLGSLIAPSGTISIATSGDLVVGPDALISVAGQWINNDMQAAAGTTPGDSEYIDGGSIALSTALASSASAGIPKPGDVVNDLSGSIVLEAGSVLDVSSGGELQANGQLLTQNGIPEGTAGSLTLITYANNMTSAFGNIGAPSLPTSQPDAGHIEMDGTIKSLGFAGGGTLTLQALGFQIGGDPTQAPAWDLYLPANFFAQQGFGKYVLNAMYDATIAPGASVALTQQNLMPDVAALRGAASGADITANGLTAAGTLDPYHRQATDLVITAGDYVNWRISTTSANIPQYDGVTGAVTVGAGASIIGDAGASIGLGSPTQVTVLGSIVAPGGSITLSADSNESDSHGDAFALPGQQTSQAFTSPGDSVWLGPDAVLDVAGVALTNPLAAPVREGLQTVIPDTGKVLPGGSVIISDDAGYVVAQAGAMIDVSGASASFDELQPSGHYARQPVWSDAGSITLAAAAGLYFDGTLQAEPGAAQAQGGTLNLLPEQDDAGFRTTPIPSAQVLILQQSGERVPAGLEPGQSIADAGGSTNAMVFSVDRLTGSGISTLVLGDATSANASPVPVAFAGNVDLSLAGSVIINASTLLALPAGSTSLPTLAPGVSEIGAPNVTISAPYVALVAQKLNTSGAFTPVQAVADGTLDIDAAFIDLVNKLQLDNFGQANFTSSGDIRLTSTFTPNQTLGPGELYTSGNLTFKAADVYPSTGSTFILDAVAPTDASTNSAAATTITFLSNGSSGVPLSAGGTLLVDATDIVQSGTVRAPSGSLIFGVGDTTDAATQTQFDNLPLVATDSVALTGGSVTSVSNDGAIIPFGTTVDGVEWQFNVVGSRPQPDLTAPPAKFISVNGSNVSLNGGASIDLSGGGDLQAEEWVPGTGGTRDVLSQYNVSFASNSTGVAIPVQPGAGNIYAILPGAQSRVAAYDPIFAQTVQPSTNSNGTPGTVTVNTGVGQAALNSALGESVYLSGVPGLPAGYYTLLPAKYATLPGAFRVTVSSASGAIVPGSSEVLPDGTVAVAGYLGNALTGSRSATPTLFDVQSGAVWQQYSQYTLSSANAFFPPLAAGTGSLTPPLPMDAGQLVLAAAHGLTLGATLNTAAAPGGAPAEIDIASQDIQIVGNGEAALPGYLQISADQLDALDAGSLLIGGTRTQTSSGITIVASANSVVVSNDANDPLTGPEIILVTKSGSTSTDPNAANGLRVDSGSVIAAQGSFPAGRDVPITIGQNADSSTNTLALSGDGALLSVTNGGDAVVTRLDTTGTGLLTVAAGATLTGGQALTLDSSGNLTFDPSATLSGNTIAVDGSAITFTSQTGAAAAALPGFVVGPTQLAQLANAQNVILRSSGSMNFDGNVDVTFGNNVDLSAGSFSSDGGAVTINAPDVAFTNEMGAPVPTSVTGTGTLSVNANEIDFGTGDKTVNGFDSATFNASGGIVGQGTGTFDFGALPVTLNAPVYLADTSSNATLKTSGTLNLNSASGTALTLTPVGGALSFIGGTLNDNGATIEAPSGNVSLEATSGDLTIGSGALVSSAGVSKQFFDVTLFAPAGAITLTADTGSVNVQAGSTLDFSGANGGGAAGSLSLSAPDQTVQLAGTIKGSAAAGFLGGSFSLNTGGAVDLDNLATELASSGVNDAISVQSNAGNLTLSPGNTLTAHVVSLTADGGAGGQDPNNGNVQIFGTVNANGNAGGEIDLYGKSGVDVEGSLLARACATGNACDDSALNASQRGGAINIGTTGTPNVVGGVVQLDPTYGYEEVSSANSGKITVGANALIDVSGGTAGGLSNGTVNFRAPLLDLADDSGVNVSIAPVFNPGKGIVGSRATTLEAYAVWSTDDPMTAGASKHFDGIVDPAGWYQAVGPNATPQLVEGSFTDQSGNTITYTPGTYVPANGSTPAHWTPAMLSNDPGATWAQIKTDLANDLENDFFTPSSGAANSAHQTFYGYQSDGTTPGTLMGFVENFPLAPSVIASFANVQNFSVAPGIELDNPDANINDGNISILTNWNLGAGTSPENLAFRFNGQAPVITFRADNNVQVDASLTDGFFQIANPINPGSSANVTVPGYLSYSATLQNYSDQFAGSFGGLASPYGPFLEGTLAYYGVKGPNPTYAGVDTAPVNFSVAGATVVKPGDTIQGEVNEYLALYEAYANFLLAQSLVPDTASGTINALSISDAIHRAGTPLKAPLAPPATEQAQNPGSYLAYLMSYQTYLDTAPEFAALQVLAAPLPELVGEFGVAPGSVVTVSFPAAADNTPSPVATSANPLPLSSASLTGGNSSSFRVVAGANLNSANPLALQAAALFDTGSGSVTLNGHFGYVDTNNSLTMYVPTTIRTGTGSINIAAGNDVTLSDTTAPGVIYAAGAPNPDAPAEGNAATIIQSPSPFDPAPDILVSPTVNPDSAGDVTLYAQHNITGIEATTDTTGAVTGAAGTNLTQLWWQWMEVGANPSVSRNQSTAVVTLTPLTQTSIDFGAFDQGVMSVGGNVSVSAGGNISDLAVSLPTTWYLNGSGAVVTVGGGNLNVTAGGNILSGDYFVAKGTGTITAGGQIGSDISIAVQFGQPANVAMLLATQDGVFNVSARQGVDIQGVVDPSYVQNSTLFNTYLQHVDEQGYSSTSAVNVESTTGNVNFGPFTLPLGGSGGGIIGDNTPVLPATVNLTAFTGGITIDSTNGTLFPSATGNLNLIADQSINFNGTGSFGMSNADPASMPSPTQEAVSMTGNVNDVNPLHADDTVPARIYSLNGSIVDGTVVAGSNASTGPYEDLVNVVVDKPALIEAGQDIVNLDFQGENLRDADVTRIVAGRDIVDRQVDSELLPALVLGGPGTFDVEAGRNIGPLTKAGNSAVTGAPSGIDAVGNADDPNLPHESANVQVLFGVGPGIDDAAFISTYIDPASVATGVPSTTPALIAFMQQYDAGQVVDTGLAANAPTLQPLSASQAWTQFQALPAYVQQLFVEKVFFSVLTDVGQDFNNPASPFFSQYGRGFQAINTLFPASLGYTENNLGGGSNGANALVDTGNLDIRSSTIQTQQGGNVSILGPGGQALIGSSSAPPISVDSMGNVIAGPGSQGILTLEQGDIDIFTDQSLLLAQSRVFTEQGGNMTIWSSNGNIDAGKGSTSVADVPPPQYVCDANHFCTVDARGEVTGAGIATLQTIPGAARGDVNLLAPRGTVDAGAAGIRVSGNLNIAALKVLNADNIQVQGKATGVPVVAAVDTGALTAASAATSAVTQMAQNIVKNNASGVPQRHWLITVQVEGFGDPTDNDDAKRKRKPVPVAYNPLSQVSVLGVGAIGETQRGYLTKEEQKKLGGV